MDYKRWWIYHYRKYTRSSRRNDNNRKWKKPIDLNKSWYYPQRLAQFHFYDWVEDPTSKIMKTNPHRLCQYKALVSTSSCSSFISSSSTSNSIIIRLKIIKTTTLIALYPIYTTLPHLSHSTPPSNSTQLILLYPTYPTLSHLSCSTTCIQLYPTHITLTQASNIQTWKKLQTFTKNKNTLINYINSIY